MSEQPCPFCGAKFKCDMSYPHPRAPVAKQPAQVQQDEPVYQVRWNMGESFDNRWSDWSDINVEEYERRLKDRVERHQLRTLYTYPQPLRTLTDDEISDIFEQDGMHSINSFARAILAAAGAAPVTQMPDTFKDRIDEAYTELPYGWNLNVCLEKDAGWIELTDAEGNDVDLSHHVDIDTMSERFKNAIELAIKGAAHE